MKPSALSCIGSLAFGFYFFFVVAQTEQAVLHAAAPREPKPPLATQSNCTFGCKITKIQRSSSAYKAGLRMGDVVVKIQNDNILPASMLGEKILQTPKGAFISVQILRKRKGVLVFDIPGEGKGENSKQSSVASSSASSVSSASAAIDSLPWNEPKTSLLVLGTTTPVMQICKGKKEASYLLDDAGAAAYIKEMQFYDIASRKYLETSKNNGKGEWYTSKKLDSYYERWLLKPGQKFETSTPTFSSTHWIAIKKLCDGTESNLSYFLTPAAITDVRAEGPETDRFYQGQSQRIGQFVLTGTKSSPDAKITLKKIQFTAYFSSNLVISNIRLERTVEDTAYSAPCLFNNSPMVECDTTEFISDITGDTHFTVRADIVKKSGTTGSVQLELTDFGSPFKAGSIQWKNDNESFSWVSPFAKSVKSTKYELAQ